MRAKIIPIIEGTTVHFVYYDPRARMAAITGELNDWCRTGVDLPMSLFDQSPLVVTGRAVDHPEPRKE